MGARGAAFQIRLGNGHQFFVPSRGGRETVGWRQVFGAHGLSEDRRPRSRCDQIGRDDPARLRHIQLAAARWCADAGLWQEAVRYLTGDERDFASVKEIKAFILSETEAKR